MRGVFDYYNAKGGFKDANGKTRKINFLVKDDGYDPARTIPMVDEYLDSDKVFTVWTSGSPSTLKTYDKINQRCVAHPMAVTGHPAWGDPVNHPWTTGAPALVYSTESILWATFLAQHASEIPAGQKIKVAALVLNNDFGKIYDASFKAAVAQSPELRERVEYKTDTLEPVGADDHRPDDDPGVGQARHVHGHDRRHVLHPGRDRGGPERHARVHQVAVPAGHLRRHGLREEGQGGRRRLCRQRLVDHEPGPEGPDRQGLRRRRLRQVGP